MPYVRCSRDCCRARRTLARHPAEYTRLPRCRGCGCKMTADPVSRTEPHYVIDRYRAKKERGPRAGRCYPGRDGCSGYHFPHRRGSGYCDHNPNLTMEQLRERHEGRCRA